MSNEWCKWSNKRLGHDSSKFTPSSSKWRREWKKTSSGRRLWRQRISRADKVSISPTFYAKLFCTNLVCKAFLYVQFDFVIFWQKNISAKVLRKILVKLAKGRKMYDNCIWKLERLFKNTFLNVLAFWQSHQKNDGNNSRKGDLKWNLEKLTDDQIEGILNERVTHFGEG